MQSEHFTLPRVGSFNATAFRIVKTLQWLWEGPLTLEELNDHFQAHPWVGRRLSPDSIWLCMNTLRQLGCEISRPAPTNGFHFELLHHPFGFPLREEHTSTLLQVRQLAKENLSGAEMLVLDRFMKSLIRQSSFRNSERLIEELFEKSRSVDYEAEREKISQLQELIERKALLLLCYRPTPQNERPFMLIPEELAYWHGRLYLRGTALDREEPTMLRIEYVSDLKALEPKEYPEQYRSLLARQRLKTQVIVDFFDLTPEDFEPFGMGETLDSLKKPENATGSVLRMSLRTRDFFLLKQKLLESGYRFQIIEPLIFRQDVLSDLQTLQKRYS